MEIRAVPLIALFLEVFNIETLNFSEVCSPTVHVLSSYNWYEITLLNRMYPTNNQVMYSIITICLRTVTIEVLTSLQIFFSKFNW